jgi:hypothetical protein
MAANQTTHLKVSSSLLGKNRNSISGQSTPKLENQTSCHCKPLDFPGTFIKRKCGHYSVGSARSQSSESLFRFKLNLITNK